MAYSRVTRTANGRDALAYAYGHGKGHNDNDYRNQFIGLVNLLPGVDVADQMEQHWIRARENHKTQVLRVVQSFSLNELRPDDKNDIMKANLIGQKFAERYYENRQAVVFTQIDGKSGLIHNHIIINDCDMTDAKGTTKEQYHFPNIKAWTNEVASEYFELDLGVAKTPDKVTRTERTKRNNGEYVWKDDLKNRIRTCMNEATSEDDFFELLKQNNVHYRVGNSKTHGKYITYELDKSVVPKGEKIPDKGLKARSFKLGTDFGFEALERALQGEMGYVLDDDIDDDIDTPEDVHDDVSDSITENKSETVEDVKPEPNKKDKEPVKTTFTPDYEKCAKDLFDYSAYSEKRNKIKSYYANDTYRYQNSFLIKQLIKLQKSSKGGLFAKLTGLLSLMTILSINPDNTALMMNHISYLDDYKHKNNTSATNNKTSHANKQIVNTLQNERLSSDMVNSSLLRAIDERNKDNNLDNTFE